VYLQVCKLGLSEKAGAEASGLRADNNGAAPPPTAE